MGGASMHGLLLALLGAERGVLVAERAANLCYDDRPREAGLYDGEIFVDGLRRTYVLFVPPTYDGHHPMPLIVNCPNTGVTALEELHQSGLVEGGRGEHYLVVTLNGVNKAFNVLENAQANPSGPDDVKFARTVYKYLATRMCLDASRVYATGISRGGRFASRLASEMSDIIAAVGIVSGIRYPTPNNATRPVPIIAFHGTADPINPFADGGPAYWKTGVEDAIKGWAKFNGCKKEAVLRVADSIVKELYYDCLDNADVALYKIEGGGHTWPGSTFYYHNQGRLRQLGKATMDISASDLAWDFWERHAAMRLDKNYWKHLGIKTETEIVLATVITEPAPLESAFVGATLTLTHRGRLGPWPWGPTAGGHGPPVASCALVMALALALVGFRRRRAAPRGAVGTVGLRASVGELL